MLILPRSRSTVGHSVARPGGILHRPATVRLCIIAGHLRVALARRDFRRLLLVRLLGQFGDGVFQVILAGAVLFNPERQAHAADVAAGFAVILLPYSFIGPFAGVLLDRWWRQRVLVLANLLRAVLVLGVAAEVAAGVDNQLFYVSALVVVSVNRFFLSTLSASLPHVVDPPGARHRQCAVDDLRWDRRHARRRFRYRHPGPGRATPTSATASSARWRCCPMSRPP